MPRLRRCRTALWPASLFRLRSRRLFRALGSGLRARLQNKPRASCMAAAAAAPAVPQSGITRSLPWRRCPEAERGRARTPAPLPGSSPRSPDTVTSASPDVPGRRHDAAGSRRAGLPQSPGQDLAEAPPTAADSRGPAAARSRPFPAPAERGDARWAPLGGGAAPTAPVQPRAPSPTLPGRLPGGRLRTRRKAGGESGGEPGITSPRAAATARARWRRRARGPLLRVAVRPGARAVARGAAAADGGLVGAGAVTGESRARLLVLPLEEALCRRRARGCAQGAAVAGRGRAGSGRAGPGKEGAAGRAAPPGPVAAGSRRGTPRSGAGKVWQRRRVPRRQGSRGARGGQRLPLGRGGRGRPPAGAGGARGAPARPGDPLCSCHNSRARLEPCPPGPAPARPLQPPPPGLRAGRAGAGLPGIPRRPVEPSRRRPIGGAAGRAAGGASPGGTAAAAPLRGAAPGGARPSPPPRAWGSFSAAAPRNAVSGESVYKARRRLRGDRGRRCPPGGWAVRRRLGRGGPRAVPAAGQLCRAPGSRRLQGAGRCCGARSPCGRWTRAAAYKVELPTSWAYFFLFSDNFIVFSVMYLCS